MLLISNTFVVASRRSTTPAVNEVFLDRNSAQERISSLDSSIPLEVISLSEALSVFANNVRADESYVVEFSNYR
jgi:hypothetical protein